MPQNATISHITDNLDIDGFLQSLQSKDIVESPLYPQLGNTVEILPPPQTDNTVAFGTDTEPLTDSLLLSNQQETDDQPSLPEEMEPVEDNTDALPDYSTLNSQQRLAIQMLLSGKTETAVANELGKNRSTISRWRKNPHFISEYNKQMGELEESVKTRLHNLTEKAVNVLETHLDAGSIKAAIALLKMTNPCKNAPYSTPQPSLEKIVRKQVEELCSDFCVEPFEKKPAVTDLYDSVKPRARGVYGILKNVYNIGDATRDFYYDI